MMCTETVSLGTAFVYGLILIGAINNIAVLGIYSYGVVLLVRRLRGTK